MSYSPPSGGAANFSWAGVESYAPPSGDAANFSWVEAHGSNLSVYPSSIHTSVVSPPQVSFGAVLAKGFDSAGVSSRHLLTLRPLHAFDEGSFFHVYFDALSSGDESHIIAEGLYTGAFGAAALKNVVDVARPSGWSAGESGTPRVDNSAEQIVPQGFVASVFSDGSIVWNLRQYVLAQGFASPMFGAAYVQGGVKFVFTAGIPSFASGAHTVINTTANRALEPTGIAAPLVFVGGWWQQVPPPGVSPQFLRPGGVYGTTAGFPRVQFPPHPVGWLSSTFGYPVVDYKTKIVQPAGVSSFSEGFPRVADRARKLLHAASPVTSVFGDVQIRTKNFRISVPGWLSQVMSPWAEFRSTRRFVAVASVPAPGVGPGTTAHNKTPSVAPVGFYSTEFGRLEHTVIGWRNRSALPSGVPVPFPSFGLPSLWQTPSLAPAGVAAPDVPAPTIWPAVRSVATAGANMQVLPGPTVWFSYRHVVAQGFGIAGTSYGTARVEHGRRGIAMLGSGYLSFGTAWVSRGLRALAPLGIPDPLLSLHQIGGTRWLGPEGFEATRWLTRITPESREVFPKTFVAEYGMPLVQNKVRPVFLTGFRTYPDDWRHWGVAKVWNRRQIITMYEDQESGLWPLPWPQWTVIENRNKVMRVSGFNAGRFTGATVENNARLVHPSGIAHPALPEYQKTGSVTHRVRPLLLDGVEPPLMSRWAVAHNAARPLLPQGFDAILSGQAQVVNLRRFRHVQGFYSAEFGYPMIADRIRTLSFESRYGIHPPRIELPKVHLNTRYVEPQGMANPDVGNASLTIFFRRATPHWTHRDLFGDPFIWNKTPELRTRGRSSDEYGDMFVRLEWRPLVAEGKDTQLFGLTRISDRRQRVEVPGMTHTVVSDKVTVRRFGEDPVATQYIDLRVFVTLPGGEQSESENGHGIPPPLLQVGRPNLEKGYIFHKDGYLGSVHDMVLWGRPVVHANSIRVEPGIFGVYVGEPFVSLLHRQINVPSLGQLVVGSSGDGMASWGKPRITPHTIHATSDVTFQAVFNHGNRSWYPPSSGITAGWPTVTKWNNDIRPHGISETGALGGSLFWGVGTPRLVNKRQYIAPYGTQMQRIGWPVIPGPQDIIIEVPATGYATGTPTVSRPPYIGPQTVVAGGASFQNHGAAAVDFRNRSVRPSGWVAELMGGPTPPFGNHTLYMPQNLHVGPRRPTIPLGYVATGYGVPWVSLRVRELQAKGHNSFLSEYDLENFAKRMRVRNAITGWLGRRTVATHGHQSSRVGAPGVRPGTHYIRPDGNSDQYRKGAF